MPEEFKYYKDIIKNNVKIELIMIRKNEQNFQMACKCHICNKSNTEKDIRVRDHCYIPG